MESSAALSASSGVSRDISTVHSDRVNSSALKTPHQLRCLCSCLEQSRHKASAKSPRHAIHNNLIFAVTGKFMFLFSVLMMSAAVSGFDSRAAPIPPVKINHTLPQCVFKWFLRQRSVWDIPYSLPARAVQRVSRQCSMLPRGYEEKACEEWIGGEIIW
eukprot:553064-Hanusia_phi.AAC.5